MNEAIRDIARSLSRYHDSQPCVLRLGKSAGECERVEVWRPELRRVGVPVLELNGAPEPAMSQWLEAASAFSEEFMMPVVAFGSNRLVALDLLNPTVQRLLNQQPVVEDPAWLAAREIALTRAVETSPLNQEYRRQRGRQGWIRLGWHSEAELIEGNGLLLAWSSPLPLRRIRDFAARCPEITLIGAGAEALAAEVAAQGISVSGWRFAVK